MGGGAPAVPAKRQLFTDDDLDNEDFLAALQSAETEATAKRPRVA